MRHLPLEIAKGLKKHRRRRVKRMQQMKPFTQVACMSISTKPLVNKTGLENGVVDLEIHAAIQSSSEKAES